MGVVGMGGAGVAGDPKIGATTCQAEAQGAVLALGSENGIWV